MPPMMDRDCWENLSTQSRHDLNNTIDIVLASSCDEEAAQSEIESILNEECSKLNSNGDLSGDEQGGVVSIEQGMANSEFGDNFNNQVNNLLGFGSTLNQNNPILAANKPLCDKLLKVRPHASNPNSFVAGFSGIQFSFKVPTSDIPLVLTFANLHFQTNATNCEYSFDTAVTNAINSAIQTMQKRIDGGATGLKNNELLTLINQAYQKELEHCTPHHGTTVGLASALSDGSPNCGGAEFVRLKPGDCN